VDRETIKVLGELMGRRVNPTSPQVYEEVVRVTVENGSECPAENSMILIQNFLSGTKRARYLSWIGYADLDEASIAEPRVWHLIEPAVSYEAEIEWLPFG